MTTNSSIIHNINYYVLQWVGVRIARVLHDKTDKQTGWTVLFVLPLSRYNGRPFKYWYAKNHRKD